MLRFADTVSFGCKSIGPTSLNLHLKFTSVSQKPEPVMLLSLEGMGAKLVEGMWVIDWHDQLKFDNVGLLWQLAIKYNENKIVWAVFKNIL